MVTIKKAWILYLHEGRVLLRQGLTYWILAAYLMLLNALTLGLGDFYNLAHASLLPLFLNIPILGSLFIPLLTMSQWAKPKTLAALPWFFSFPLPLWSVVLARFALAWSFALVALFASAPLSLTLTYLGTPDWGTIAAGYLILSALCAFQVAWGSLASALTPHQVAAYVLAASGNIVFLGLGSHLLFEKIPAFLPLPWTDRLSPLGVPYHLVAGFRGVIDLRDVLYFGAWTLFCLYLNQSILHNKRKQKRPGRSTIFAYFATGTGIFLAILLARDAHVRFDFTEERLYTLSRGTRDIIGRMEKPVHAELYFTRSQIPPALKLYGERIEELLREYSATSPKNFRLHLIDPRQDSEEEVQARIAGMQAISGLTGENIYLGLALRQGDHRLSIPLFNIQTAAQLEYELTEILVRLQQAAKPSLGIMSQLPLVGDELGENANLRNDWAFVSALRSLFQIVSIPIQATAIPPQLQTLVLVHPKNLGTPTLFALDQFLMRGGKLIVFLDAFCRYEINFPNGGQDHSTFSSQLSPFLVHWGLTFHNESLVGDSSRSTRVAIAQMNYDYPFQLQLTSAEMNQKLPVSRNLQKLNFLESGWFEPRPSAAYRITSLVTALGSSGVVPTKFTEYMSPQQIAAELKPEGQERIMVALIQGKFTSIFGQMPEGSVGEFKKEADASGSVIVVSDVDFLSDSFTVDKIQSLGQMVYKPKGDNMTFLMNALDYINGNQDLIAIRSRVHVDRSLHRVLAIQKLAAERFVGQDAALEVRLTEIQEKLGQWETNRSREIDPVASKDQQLMIQQLREEEAKIRRERRLLKESSEAQYNHLKSNIFLLHALVIPVSVLIGLFRIWRQRRAGARERESFE